MKKKIVILQSNYIPWKGYFDLLYNCDEFIFLDNVQYTKNDWRNRNQLKTKDGLQWLTIPVNYKFSDRPRISDIKVSDKNWGQQHLAKLQECYQEAPHFDSHWLSLMYAEAAGLVSLSEINQFLLQQMLFRLGIHKKLSRSVDYMKLSELDSLDSNERLIRLCELAEAQIYLSGPSAKEYLNESMFKENNIAVAYANYENYPEYRQLHPPFAHQVTMLDLIFNTGADTLKYMKKEKLFL